MANPWSIAAPQTRLGEVEKFRQLFSMPNLPDLPRFTGGLVGYFGYDTVRFVESRLADSAPADELGTPDIYVDGLG